MYRKTFIHSICESTTINPFCFHFVSILLFMHSFPSYFTVYRFFSSLCVFFFFSCCCSHQFTSCAHEQFAIVACVILLYPPPCMACAIFDVHFRINILVLSLMCRHFRVVILISCQYFFSFSFLFFLLHCRSMFFHSIYIHINIHQNNRLSCDVPTNDVTV